MLNLSIITVSTRPGRAGPIFAKWFYDLAIEHSKFDVTAIDLAEVNLPLFDEPQIPLLNLYENEHTKGWSKMIKAADALVFVTPEYDFFVPASLVNAIDYLAHEWHYKPAGLVGYGGASGGLRAIQAVKPLIANMGMMPLPASVSVHHFAQFINEDNVFQPNEEHLRQANNMLEELNKWATALKPLRDPKK